MKTKKIVIISPYLYDLSRGIERFTINLSDAMVKKGIDVIIYTWSQRKGKLCGELNPKVRIRRVPYCRYYRELWARWLYRCWLKIDKPDTTLLNFLYHGEETLPAMGRYLYLLHSPASQVPQRYEYAAAKISRFDNMVVVATSGLVERDARPYFQGKAPMTLIYNGTDTETFRPLERRNRGNKLKIITAAAFEERKGMHFLIEALKDYKHKDRIQYDIYGTGDGEYASRVKQMIEDYGLQEVVKCKINKVYMSQIEPEYDLYALLSKGEAFALSPIEAMACGLPILVSDCDPYPEFVDKSFGYMIDRENITAIQDALTELIENPALLESMSVKAREKALDFSWDKVVEQYMELI